MSNSTGETILAQTIVAANAAAASALAAEEAAADVASKAPIDSPAFTGTPTAPTPTDGDNSTKLATTAYQDRLRGMAGGLATLDMTGKIPSSQIPPISATNTYVVSSQAAMLALAAPASSFCIRTDLSNAVFVLSALPASTLANWYEIGTSPVLSVAGLTGAISATDLTAQLIDFAGDFGSGGVSGDVPAPAAGTAASFKYLFADGTWKQIAISDLSTAKTGSGSIVLAASPTLTGVPITTTASVDTDTGQIASAAFVLNQAGGANPIIDGTAAPGVSTRFARQDHVHPTDTSRAPLVSPALTGSPTAPTASQGDNSTHLATTAYVDTGLGLKAPLNSPALTGTPTAPTQSAHDNSMKIATTAYADAASTPPVAGAGIAVSGSTVSIDTNNALGIGSYTMATGPIGSGFSVAPGATSSTFHALDINTSDSSMGAGPVLTGTWRNVSGTTITNASAGLCLRVS